MKFETMRIHFLSDVLICCHPEILLPWQRDVTTSPLYYGAVFGDAIRPSFPRNLVKVDKRSGSVSKTVP